MDPKPILPGKDNSPGLVAAMGVAATAATREDPSKGETRTIPKTGLPGGPIKRWKGLEVKVKFNVLVQVMAMMLAMTENLQTHL